MSTTVLLLALGLTLGARCPLAQEAAPAVKISGGDELVREQGRFSETWVRPDADFSRYRTLNLWIAELQFREEGARRLGTAGVIDSTGAFALSRQEQERYRQVVTDAFTHELQRGTKLQLVDALGPGTLLLRISILDIVCCVPPPSLGLVDVYLSSVGAGTLRVELIDAETGVVQARLEQRSSIRPRGRVMNEVSLIPVSRHTMWSEVRRWSRTGAADLRRTVEHAADSDHRLQ